MSNSRESSNAILRSSINIDYNNNNSNNLIQDIKIVQHNVMCWTPERAIELSDYYRLENPDIILLNSTSINDNNKIKIYNYNIIQRNMLSEKSAGIAIAVRKNIKYRLLDDFQDDILGIELNTTKGLIIILTNYSPPRRNYVPIAEIENILQKQLPVYFAGDINASIPALGYATYNHTGRIIRNLIIRDKIKLLGPEFRTLIHRNGRPDIVFSNKLAFLNYAIIQGKLSSSDHLLVIIKLSTKPIVNIGQEKHYFSEADWDLFKEKIESKIDIENENHTLLERDDVDAQEIENSLHSWLNIITVTRDEVIPKAKLKYSMHGRESDYLKLLETVYTNIIHKLYWTREELEIIKEIQRRIMEENLRLNKEAWETKVESLNDIYKDSKKFWGNIRRLIGSDKDKTEYLIEPNNNNNRIYEDEDKETLY